MFMNFDIKVKSATVVVGRYYDMVYLTLDKPDPSPNGNSEPLSVSFKALRDIGFQYVMENFGIKPDLVRVPETKGAHYAASS